MTPLPSPAAARPTGAGINLHRDALRMALQFATRDVIEWLLMHGADAHLPVDERFLFAVQAGRGDILEMLHAHHGGIDTTDPLLARTAAEMGRCDVLAQLRRWGCAWDHVVIQNALMNDHVALAKWAVENGCPLTAAPIPEADAVRIRGMVLSLSA